MALPATVKMFAAIAKQFDADHRNCEKTWAEPIPTGQPEKTEHENAMWWAANGEHGTSSKTMFRYLSGNGGAMIPRGRYERDDHPYDPSDFRRCHLLLEAVPQWRAKLHHMKAVSTVWARLVDNWGKLTEMLKEQMITNRPNGMYELMQSLIYGKPI